jgi:hypothetical protein
VDDLRFCLAAVDEHDEEKDQPPGHTNNLITLLSIALDEVVVSHHVIRIVEDFRRFLERNPMDPLISFRLRRVPSESHLRITLLYIHTRYASRSRTFADLITCLFNNLIQPRTCHLKIACYASGRRLVA